MKKRKRIISLLIALAVLAADLVAVGIDTAVYADEANQIQTVLKMEYVPGNKTANETAIAYTGQWTISMKSVKSSKPGVAVLKKNAGCYLVVVKKAGKATISFKAKAAGTSKYIDKKIKVTAVKYVCPVKKFRIGGKNLAWKFRKNPVVARNKAISGRLKVTAKKGWKIKEIVYISRTGAKAGKHLRIRNGKTVRLKKGDSLKVRLAKGKKERTLTCMVLPEGF